MAAGNVGAPIKARDIEIHPVANGFLVMPTRDFSRGECFDFGTVHVFSRPSELASWIEQHYGPAA